MKEWNAQNTLWKPHQAETEVLQEIIIIINNPVVYFDQHLGAAHSKCWWKYAFTLFYMKKAAIEAKARQLSIQLMLSIPLETMNCTRLIPKF